MSAASSSGRERRRGADRRSQLPTDRPLRVAAVGDFHCGEDSVGVYRAEFSRANEQADVLVLAGDLTNHGTPEEMRVAVGELADVEIPIVAVLGNHDHEAGQAAEVGAILRDRGVHLLDGDAWEIEGRVGFAGTKGFMGGFGRRILTAFGEAEIKSFVAVGVEEVKRFELAFQRLRTPIKIGILHYAPVVSTVVGEPEQIFAFLGNDRLADTLERYDADVCFHGHAHHGTFRGATQKGIPVFNVSHHLIREQGVGSMFYVHEIPLPPADQSTDEAAVGAGAGSAS